MNDSTRENGGSGARRWRAEVLKGLVILCLLLASSMVASVLSMRLVPEGEPRRVTGGFAEAIGVSLAAAQWGSCAPIASRCERGEMIVKDDAAGIERRVGVRVSRVDLRFFRGLSIPVLRGRMPVESDCPHGGHEAVLNASAAHRLWPDREPLGESIRVSLGADGYLLVKVVGVIADVSFGEPPAPVVPTLYVPRARSGPAMKSFLTLGVQDVARAGEG